MGRVVITHSTYLGGLIPLLKQLAKDPKGDGDTGGDQPRQRRCQGLKLRISAPLAGAKVVARRHRAGGVRCHPGAQRLAAAARRFTQ